MQVTVTAATLAEAHDIAACLRRALSGTDWRVTVHAPLFAGDMYRVTIA